MNLKTCNVEAGFPSLDEARRLVIEEIRKAKREGVRVLKIIHGYGSSGKGGTLNHGLRKSFALRKKEGVIKDSSPARISPSSIPSCWNCLKRCLSCERIRICPRRTRA